MADQKITCPECKHEFELAEAFAEQFREEGRASAEEKAERRLGERVEAAAREAREKIELELVAKSREAEDLGAKLTEARRMEVELRRKERELADRQAAQELELERRVADERKKAVEGAALQAAEREALKLRERDDHIATLKEQIGELQRRADVSSQERQGEALEGELIDLLRLKFPSDELVEIKKGARGADIEQRVRGGAGGFSGTILWETKNTKDFQKSWIDKLKKDQQEAGADIAVLVSVALPPTVTDLDLVDDVWVCAVAPALGLAAALRQTLNKLDRERLVARGKGSMKDVIYDYVTGEEFARRVKMVVGAYRQMHEDLESEKRSMNRIWKKRGRQLDTVLDNLTGMYGELEGLAGVGERLPEIDVMSLGAIAADEEDEE